jgi:uncharacterized protein YggU (UPF0235/DUF167 family)
VSLAAAPVEGEANDALVRLLGRVLRVPPSAIRIVRGHAARQKLLRIEGLGAATLRERLEPREPGR